MDTKVHRSSECVEAYSVFGAGCPTRDTLSLVGDKWAVLVVLTLREGPCRFGELRRRLSGVTQKMLTQTLRELERDGLVSRTVVPTRPPSVEYALTGLGRTLIGPLRFFSDWAEQNIEAVLAARRAFDSDRS